jgi:dihydrofolate reductase
MNRPLLTLIAAVSADGFISRGRGVPWHLPEDKRHFRAYTAGKWLLLGRQTYEEMLGWFQPGHVPLVLTRQPQLRVLQGRVVAGVPDALKKACLAPELVCCGGAAAYAGALPYADQLVLTHVADELKAGLPFPAVDPLDWQPVRRVAHGADAHHAHDFEIVFYQRIRWDEEPVPQGLVTSRLAA